MGMVSSLVQRLTGLASLSALLPRAKSLEGQVRPGPYMLDDGSFIPATWGQFWNFFQLGKDPIRAGAANATVQACIKAYAETIAMLPAYHMRDDGNGGAEKVLNSGLSRVLRRPNGYQSRSDFHVNLINHLFWNGDGIAVATRSGRQEIAALHLLPPKSARARIDHETGEVWYAVTGNPILDADIRQQDPTDIAWLVPMRDVLHVRMFTLPENPFAGISPLNAAMMAQAQATAITGQQTAFFANMARPSGVLQTDMPLDAAQIDMLRKKWQDHSSGKNAGGVPILSAGLKWQSLTLSAAETQMIEQLKWTSGEIMRALRVPPMVAGDMTGSTWNNAEQLISFWLSTGLGFVIDHLENAYDRLAGLPEAEWVEFDLTALARPLFKERIEALARAVQAGIYTINEARNDQGKPKKEGGDEPRVQQQVVPLSAWQEGGALAAPAAPAALPAPANDDDEEDDDEAMPAKAEIARRLRARIHAKQDR